LRHWIRCRTGNRTTDFDTRRAILHQKLITDPTISLRFDCEQGNSQPLAAREEHFSNVAPSEGHVDLRRWSDLAVC
jgi:hypothetical protein